MQQEVRRVTRDRLRVAQRELAEDKDHRQQLSCQKLAYGEQRVDQYVQNQRLPESFQRVLRLCT